MVEPLAFDSSPLYTYLQDSTTPSHSHQSPLPRPTWSSTSSPSAHGSPCHSNTSSVNHPQHRRFARHSSNSNLYPDDCSSLASVWSHFARRITALVVSIFLPWIVDSQHKTPAVRLLQGSSATLDETATKSSMPQASLSQETSFAERFKLVICSSFLLTSSLSISFYGVQSDTHALPKKAVSTPTCVPQGQRPASIPITARPTDLVLPRLDQMGKSLTNVILLSSVIIAVRSPSWTAWTQTVLILLCMSCACILLFELSSLDEARLCFQLSRRPQTQAFLRRSPIHGNLSEREREALQSVAVQKVSRLVRAFQEFDISVNQAINAIQEVELVSRGYKLTQPLPPISRIEAASGSAWASRTIPTPPRRTVLLSTAGNTRPSPSPSGVGRSLSYRRHNQRPSSLSLSNGRPTSSEGVIPSFDADLRSVSAGNAPPRRLLELRQVILLSLDQTSYFCESTAASLDGLIDNEEFALLKDMYALHPHSSAEAGEVDVSTAWANQDVSMTSGTSTSSPLLGNDRHAAWTSTIPRNFGSSVRQTDVPLRTFPSPRSGHKRLSLTSDSGSILNNSTDRLNGASSSLSCRSNLFSDHGNSHTPYRSPRLHYVSDKAGMALGPNDSAALKRLSGRSVSSAASSSRPVWSPTLHSAPFASGIFAPASPIMSSTHLPSIDHPTRGTKRNSMLAMSASAHSHLPNSDVGCEESSDDSSLLGLKSRFEAMHRTRQQILCRLLALQFSLNDTITTKDGRSQNPSVYWYDVGSLMDNLRHSCEGYRDTVKETIKREMGSTLPRTGNRQDASDLLDGNDPFLAPGESKETSAGRSRIIGHPGLEDRLNAMMLALRSIQAKIRVCAEDIQVKTPPGLHGIDDLVDIKKDERHADEDRSESMERVLETMRDDLLGLSSEWEASLVIVRKQESRPASQIYVPDEGINGQNLPMPRGLHSSLETDDPLASSSDVPYPADTHDSMDLASHQAAGEDGDNDLAPLLLASTSPDALPPPGLEQVFESIAGMAGMPELLGRRMTRDERIAQARLKRQEFEDTTPESRAGALDSSGIMSELSGVIHSRKAAREQLLHQPDTDLGINPDTLSNENVVEEADKMHAFALGSPLDLGNVGREGVFGELYTGGDSRIGARRSMSSLSIARARSLQALEASDSFSDGFSDDRSRSSEEFSFEATTLESVPEDGSGPPADSLSVRSTPRATQTSLNRNYNESPFDLGAQVAAYARRKAAAAASTLRDS